MKTAAVRGILVLTWLLMTPFAAPGYDASRFELDRQQSELLLDKVPVEDLMGPLAPVALSPFFGIACLSGASILVDQGYLPAHPLLAGNRALNRPSVFVAFLLLAIFTSLPRLTKVSKPVAQAADLLETYAGIVAVIVMFHLAAPAESGDTAAVYTAGVGSLTPLLLAAAATVNILVIQTVRFFFEFLVFLSPIPFLDALFEGINKAVCLALVALYVASPALAFGLNILLFLLCLALFGRVHRRVVFYRHIFAGPAARKLAALITRRAPVPPRLRRDGRVLCITVFPRRRIGRIKPSRRCRLKISAEALVLIPGPAWPRTDVQVALREDFLSHIAVIRLPGEPDVELRFSRSYTPVLPEIATALGSESEPTPPAVMQRPTGHAAG